MWPAIAITVFLSALLITAFRLRSGELAEARAVLRHTISVNLDILDSELVELKAIAQAAPPTPAQQSATELLQQSQTVAHAARRRVQVASNEELETILGLVFGAMNQSTDARRLLNACTPR